MALRESRPTWGARKLLWQLGQEEPRARLPAERTAQRWLRAAGKVRTRPRRPQRSGPTAVEPKPALKANDVWTIDFTGWYLAENGERVEPLTVRDLATRYILAAEPLEQRTELAVRKECERLFGKYGRPKAIRVDLGTPFCGAGPYGRTALSLWWHRRASGWSSCGAGIFGPPPSRSTVAKSASKKGWKPDGRRGSAGR